MSSSHAVTSHSTHADHSTHVVCPPTHGHDPHDFAHPLPVWVLLAVFFALTFLTIVTVAQANFNLGTADVFVVMGIATVKAILVMLFFMHLAFDKPFNLIIFLSSFVFVALFIIFTLTDAHMNSPTFEPVVDEVVTAGSSPEDISAVPDTTSSAPMTTTSPLGTGTPRATH